MGVYAYRGYDEIGSLIVSGWLALTSRVNPMAGTWRLRGIGDPGQTGPQIGEGVLRGSVYANGLNLNLNPGNWDNNVVLSGTLTDDSYTGTWTHITFAGPAAGGTFVAEKTRVRLFSPSCDDGVFAFTVELPEGMRCIVEYTESLASESWTELSQMTGSGPVVPVKDTAPAGPARFYRVRVLDAPAF